LREGARRIAARPEQIGMSDKEATAGRTTATSLSEDRWKEIGRGPAIVGAYGSEILFAAGADEPAADDIGLLLRFDTPPLPVQTRHRLWAKACFGARNARAVVLPLDSLGVSPVTSKNFR
jgi:hypothetical protein